MDRFVSLFAAISSVALAPVLLGLLIAAAVSMLELGAALGESLARWRARSRRRALEGALLKGERLLLEQRRLPGPLGRAIVGLVEADRLVAQQRALDGFEDEVERALSKDSLVVKLGPSLGLMGTLIPLGPALEFLAVGQLEQMTKHLVLAFATTVVGMAAAGVSTLSLSWRRRMFAQDWRLLMAIAEVTALEAQPDGGSDAT